MCEKQTERRRDCGRRSGHPDSLDSARKLSPINGLVINKTAIHIGLEQRSHPQSCNCRLMTSRKLDDLRQKGPQRSLGNKIKRIPRWKKRQNTSKSEKMKSTQCCQNYSDDWKLAHLTTPPPLPPETPPPLPATLCPVLRTYVRIPQQSRCRRKKSSESLVSTP